MASGAAASDKNSPATGRALSPPDWNGKNRRIRPRLRSIIASALAVAYLLSLIVAAIALSLVGPPAGSTYLYGLLLLGSGLGLVLLCGFIFIRRRFIEPLEEMVTKLRVAPREAVAPHWDMNERATGEIGAIASFINHHALVVRDAQSALTSEVEERTLTEARLRSSRALLRAITDTAPDAIICVDERGGIILWNPSAAKVFGHAEEEILGQSLDTVIAADQEILTSGPVRAFLEKEVPDVNLVGVDAKATCSDGSVFDAEIAFSGWEGEEGRCISVFIRDVTEKRQSEERIRFLAHHDSLTELPNRTLFNDRLAQALALAKRDKSKVGLMVLDLDNFKEINDTLGHASGDRLLIEVAERLNSQKRETDTVARLGGDEFALVLPQFRSAADTETLATRLIDLVGEPMALDGHDVQVGTSIGVALYPDDAADLDQMIAHADMAMYQAKEDGRNTYRLFAEQMDAEVKDRKQLLADMRQALTENGFELAFQPQISLNDHSVVGSEALLRWDHANRGPISPGRFIPIAEQGGLIVDLGQWVVDAACKQLQTFDSLGLPPIRVAVNISSVQFRRGNLVECTREILERTGASPDRLEFEITESVVMSDVDRAIEIMRQLDDMGVRISMDDFGTGYSSLSYLRQFPIQKLKIDKSFVQDIEDENDSMEIVNAIIGLSRSLNLTVVAEGVETDGQLTRLRDAGCELVQGFIFGKPMMADDFKTWMADWPGSKET